MKLVDIITEGEHTKELSIEEAIEMVKSKCSQSTDLHLYRGASQSKTAEVVISGNYASPRRSQTRNNLAMNLTSNLPSWSSYPARNRGLFMTSSYGQADGWGDVVRVFPYDTAKMVLSSSEDFNHDGTFKYMNRLLSDIPTDVGNLAKTLVAELEDAMRDDLEKDVDWRDLDSMDDIQRIDADIKQHGVDFNDLINYAHVSPKVAQLGANSLIDLFDKLMDPKKNGFHLVSPAELQAALVSFGDKRGRYEIWTNDPCVVINADALDAHNEAKK